MSLTRWRRSTGDPCRSDPAALKSSVAPVFSTTGALLALELPADLGQPPLRLVEKRGNLRDAFP
jgi:hypothetical protein